MVAVADDNNDWLEMIHEAKAHGMTYQAIADVVGVHRSYILQAVHNLGNGSAQPQTPGAEGAQHAGRVCVPIFYRTKAGGKCASPAWSAVATVADFLSCAPNYSNSGKTRGYLDVADCSL